MINKSDFFDELKELVLINSYTFNKDGVEKNAEIYKDKLLKLGYTCKEFDTDGRVANHLLFESKKSEAKRILFVGHMDTVFLPGSFEGFKEDEEWVYGPGVCDMKGGNMVAIQTLRELYRKYGSISNIDLYLVSDEEEGSYNSKYITKELAKEYDFAFVFEAAGKDMKIVNARKGAGTFHLDITGKAAHAGNDYHKGADANLEASYKLQRLMALKDLVKGTTVNVGRIEGGVGANTISPYAKLIFEVRFENNREKERLLKEIDAIVCSSNVKGTSSQIVKSYIRDAMVVSPKQMNLLEKIEKIVGKKIPTEARGGVSDANFIAAEDVAVLDGFGPYGDGDHTAKERALKRSFFERVDMCVKIADGLTTLG